MNNNYVHGYHERETIRLQDQALTLVDLLHSDTKYPHGSTVLEPGCGVGSQTITLAKNSPGARITSLDISESSLKEAKIRIEKEGLTNVQFIQSDIFNLDFEEESFDHIFICFVLEHLKHPVEALLRVKKVLRKGGSLTVIEGDHGSAYFHPDSEKTRMAIRCQVELQKKAGGNANIGRELYPLLKEGGFSSIQISPRMVYVDASKPQLVEGFTKNTFTAMIEGVRETAVRDGLMDEKSFDEGISGLYETMEDHGVFCYTFFKGVAIKE